MTQKTDSRALVRQRLYRRGKQKRYYIDLRDLGGGREALKPPGKTYATADEVVALDLAGKRVADLEAKKRGEYFGGLKRTATLGAFAREWLAYRRTFTNTMGFTRERTLRRYEQALKQLFSVVRQDERMDRFSKADAKRAMSLLANLPSRSGGTLRAASLHQVLVTMIQIYKHAADEGVVPDYYNPWSSLGRADRPKLPKSSSTDFLEVYEAATLIEASIDVFTTRLPLQELVATYLLTGGRKMEVLGLEVADIDFTRKVVHFRPNRWRDIKTNEQRTIPLWPQLETVLRNYLLARTWSTHTSGLLFCSEDSDATRQLMITAPNKAMKAARDMAADMLGGEVGEALRQKDVTPRALRTTYCSARLQTLDNGKPIAQWTVYNEMGHSSRKMVDQVYGRLGSIRHRSEAVEYRVDYRDDVSPMVTISPGTSSGGGRAESGGASHTIVDSPTRNDASAHQPTSSSEHRPAKLPVSGSNRDGRILLPRFLSDAGISKGTFLETHRRDPELMRRLDANIDYAGRLHFPELAGLELRGIRNKKPHGNRGRVSGRVCVACTGRVHPRLKACPTCGVSVGPADS